MTIKLVSNVQRPTKFINDLDELNFANFKADLNAQESVEFKTHSNIQEFVEFKTECFDYERGKCILLTSNSEEFVIKTITLIGEYTKKIDPTTPLNFSAVKRISNSLPTGEKFTYEVEIQTLLPETVRFFYGKYGVNSNCHGTAMVTAGLFPISRMQDFPPTGFRWVREKLKDIPLKNISTGDLVLLGASYNDHHSFVFLSHELCLSMNGRRAPLKLHSTSRVLTTYGLSANALKSSQASQNIKIYRKKESSNDFRPVMPCILEYWGFYDDLMSGIPAKHLKYSRLLPIHDELKKFTLSMRSDPTLPQSSKDAAMTLYDLFVGISPMDSIPKDRRLCESSVKTVDKSTRAVLTIVALVAIVWALFNINKTVQLSV